MKRVLSAFLSILLVCMMIPAAFAAEQTDYMIGDADNDREISVLDATTIQRFIADLIGEDQILLSASDADGDQAVTVLDATAVQRWIAGFEAGKDIGKIISGSDEEAIRKEIEEKIKNYQPQKGIDISSHNGDVDLNKVKAAGYTFVMIRLGFGDDLENQDDTCFEENVKKAEAAGLDWGAYLYSYALTTQEAKSEVQHTLRLLKGKHPTMPIAFDMEGDSYKDQYGMPSNETLQEICFTYLNGIKDAGYYPMLYSSLSWLGKKLYNLKLFRTFDVWVAYWSTSLGEYKNDSVGMWQYGGETNLIDTPYIDGLSGMFDKNQCFKNYPVIITAYGYNNHEAILKQNKVISDTSAPPDENYTPHPVPDGFDGVMGESLR